MKATMQKKKKLFYSNIIWEKKVREEAKRKRKMKMKMKKMKRKNEKEDEVKKKPQEGE